MRTSPNVGRMEPFKMLSNVDFPDPLAPMIPIKSPDWASMDRGRNAASLG